MSLAIGWWDCHSQAHKLLTDRRIVSGASLLEPRAKIIEHSNASTFEAAALVGDQRLYQLCSIQRGAFVSERIEQLREAIQKEGWVSSSKTGAPSWNLAGLMVCAEYTKKGLYTLDGSFAATLVSRNDLMTMMGFVGSGAEIGRAIMFEAFRTTTEELRLDDIAMRAMKVASSLRTDVGDGAALWVSGVAGVREFADLSDCEAHLRKE